MLIIQVFHQNISQFVGTEVEVAKNTEITINTQLKINTLITDLQELLPLMINSTKEEEVSALTTMTENKVVLVENHLNTMIDVDID